MAEPMGRLMRGHLTDSEMAAQLVGTLEGEGGAHLRSCPTCHKEWVRMHASLVGLASQIHARAEQSDAFFQAQRAKIASRLVERRRSPWPWQWAWAPALAAAALAAVFLTRGGAPPQRPRDSEADQALLSAVQHAIYAEVPAALRPAALLVAEVKRSESQPDHRIPMPKGDRP